MSDVTIPDTVRACGGGKTMGVFARHQPVYAAYGIATFPLNDNKKPAIRKYQKVGLPTSARFAERFSASDGLGFMTNARSRIAVLDVDTTDERVLADAMGRHGSTPLVATAASAWGYTTKGRNWFGNGQVVTSHAEVDELMAQAPDAFLLLTKLRRHNWGGAFIIANAMSETMGWSRKRFAAARAELERRDKILCIRKGSGSQGVPLYAWANGHNGHVGHGQGEGGRGEGC
jgi:hypothetical protein